LLVGTRLNVFDGVPYMKGQDGCGIPCPVTLPASSVWGTRADDPSLPDLAEPIALIGLLRDLGIGLVNVSLGNPYASPHLLRPFEYPPPDGYETPEHPLIGVDRHFRLTAAVQAKYPDLAVVGSGYSWLQAYAFQAGAANVAAGKTSFVGIGRGALTQPDFGRRLAQGEPLDRKRLCRTFSYCTALMRSKHNEMGQFATGCPPFDKDVYGPIWEQAQQTGSGDGKK
jgi:NADPH2 dehydrogenase